jgi:outer membrane biosynthesis protein TonB
MTQTTTSAARGWKAIVSAMLPLCFAGGLLLPACTRAQAKVTPDGPLEVPAPPPRDVEPMESEPPPVIPLAQEPARNTPARPRPTTPVREQPRVEPPKPEPPPTPPVEPPKPAEEPLRPPPGATLQTTPPTAEGDMERGIRAAIVKATTDLNRVDYRALNADARNQYDTAKRFITQAEQAIRAKNLVFAKSVVDKAVVLAAQLAGR